MEDGKLRAASKRNPSSIVHSPSSTWKNYALALGFFVCAMLSKTVACSLPAALLLVTWWQRGKIKDRDVTPMLPFFAVGLGLGWLTAHVEKTHVGAHGADWALSLLDRVLIAGRALWFYAGKLAWPTSLTFIYPRWEVSTAVAWQWIFPVAALALVGALWFLRNKIGRGPLVAVLFFAGTLFPALGFFNIYPMRYSFVADHFQYLASVGLIVLAVAGLHRCLRERWRALLVLPLLLGVLTFRQAGIYHDLETLWRDTLAKNPLCWMAQNNLGMILVERGDAKAGRALYEQALRLHKDYPEALNNMGMSLFNEGRVDESKKYFQRALELEPALTASLDNEGAALLSQNRVDEAIEKFREALRRDPTDAKAHNNLAAAYAGKKQWADSLASSETAVRLEPGNAAAIANLAIALVKLGREKEGVARFADAERLAPQNAQIQREFARALAEETYEAEAIVHYREAIRLAPDDAQSHYNLGALLGMADQHAEAIGQFETSIRLNPENAEAQNNLGVALASQEKFAEALPHFMEALRLKPGAAEVHKNTGIVLRQLGRKDEAVAQLREALRLQPGHAQVEQQLRELGANP